jgi:hypothetical protein
VHQYVVKSGIVRWLSWESQGGRDTVGRGLYGIAQRRYRLMRGGFLCNRYVIGICYRNPCITDVTIGTCACFLFRILRRRIRLHTGQWYLRCEMIWEKPGIEYKLRRLEQVGVGLMDIR